jgi:localization factor PodJL
MAPSTPQQQSHPPLQQPQSGASGGAALADGPWDRETAEALTRAYEESEAEWQRTRANQQAMNRAETMHRQAPPVAAPAAAGRGIDERFAAIADRLQQSLAGVSAPTSVDAMIDRLDRLEERFGSALMTVAQRSDVDGLRLMEAHIAELTTQFETLRSQLDRLDAIDGTLRDLAARLDVQAGSQRPVVTDVALQDVIDTVSQRVAASMAAMQAAAAPQSPQRLDGLEELLHRYMDERRRGEEATANALRTMEETLGNILDRHVVAGPEQADESLPPFMHHLARHHEVEDTDRDSLVAAFAEGTRVLGHDSLEPVLDAADYADPAMRAVQAPEPLLPPPLLMSAIAGSVEPAQPSAHTQSHPELRASALRAMLNAQATAVAPDRAGQAPGALKSPGREGGSVRPATFLTGRPPSLAMLAALALMFGAGYFVVSALLGDASAPAATQSAVVRQFNPAAARTVPAIAPPGPAAKLPAPPAQRPSLAPPAPDRVEADKPASAAQDKPDAASLPAWGGMIVAAFPSLPVSASPASSPNVEGVPLVDHDDARRLGAEAFLPEAITPAALRDAAGNGDPAAEFEVATRFGDGRGVQKDPRLAFVWYQRAAMHGFAPAQFRLGSLYEHGIGTEIDMQRAKIWYGRAAEQGHAKAMHNLAVAMVGTGVRRPDYAGAAHWFREAAERGVTDSQFNLAVLCQKGQGLPRDLVGAYKWFALAARSGDREAEQHAEQIRVQLGPSELQAAEEWLTAWRSRPSDQAEGGQTRAFEANRPAGE